MRRMLLGLTLLALLVPFVALQAGAASAEYRDTFDDGGYGGNDGSLEFAGPWVEFGDDGSANDDNGKVYVSGSDCSSGGCLQLDGENLVTLGSFGVERAADLSMFASAELGFDLEIEAGVLSDPLRVEVFDGATWKTLASYRLDADRHGTDSLSVTDYTNADFAVRFTHPGGLGGVGLLDTGSASIDDVAIVGTLSPTTSITSPSTTSSSTSPTTTAPTRTTTTESPTTTSTKAAPTDEPTSEERELEDDAGGAAISDDTPTTSTTTAEANGGGGVERGLDLRDPGIGLIAGHPAGLTGSVDFEGLDVLGADVTVDFSIVVEVFEEARIWLAALALVVAGVLLAGVERGPRGLAGLLRERFVRL